MYKKAVKFKANINKNLYLILIIAFTLSISIGLLLRWQYAGLITLNEKLDVRRVHTHIGFYLFLFPVVWMCFKSKSWIPRGWNFFLYLLFAFLALCSFLFLSYGKLSKALSGVVLVYWIIYAAINLTKTKKIVGWSHPFYGTLLAALSIGMVIVFGIQGQTELSGKAVRAFMMFLVWGTFVPFSLESKNYPEPSLFIWLPSIVLTSLYVMNLPYNHITFIGPIGLSFCLFHLLYKHFCLNGSSRLFIYWVMSAIGLFFLGIQVLENHYYIAIAGLHFIILGPIIQSVFRFSKSAHVWIYDASLNGMVLAICLPVWFPQYFLPLQKIIAMVSTMLVVWFLYFILNKAHKSTL